MTYTVWYKKGLIWHKIKKVKGDGTLDGDYRWFILEDERRLEFPRSYRFKFSRERFLLIQQNVKAETGQL